MVLIIHIFDGTGSDSAAIIWSVIGVVAVLIIGIISASLVVIVCSRFHIKRSEHLYINMILRQLKINHLSSYLIRSRSVWSREHMYRRRGHCNNAKRCLWSYSS